MSPRAPASPDGWTLGNDNPGFTVLVGLNETLYFEATPSNTTTTSLDLAIIVSS